MHTNLISQGHSRRKVEEGMNAHQKRDSRILGVLDVVVGACVIYLVRSLPKGDDAAIVIVLLAAMTSMRYFIDQSVRNFYLHRLDWEAAAPDDPLG